MVLALAFAGLVELVMSRRERRREGDEVAADDRADDMAA